MKKQMIQMLYEKKFELERQDTILKEVEKN